MIFADRTDAGRRLAAALRGTPLHRPLVLAVPRGGVVVGAEIARALGAELDVVLARKLRSAAFPELAIGAVAESGEVYLDAYCRQMCDAFREALNGERLVQMSEIRSRRRLYRGARTPASIAGRSVVLTDDGIATGSTLIAAVRTVRGAGPGELIVAVPVAPAESAGVIRGMCDRLVCLIEADEFCCVGAFYREFDPVSDERVVDLLGRGVAAE